MSTPSSQLSREQELALWREKKRKKEEKSRMPNIRDSFSSTGTSIDARSGGSASYRKSNFSLASNEAESRTSYRRRDTVDEVHKESPYVVPARLSSNVSCRKHRLPHRDLLTATSKLKQRSLPSKEQTPPEHIFSRSRRMSCTVDSYLKNRPSSKLLAKERRSQKENLGGSLVNQIRCRAALKRGQDGDESSKLESSTYRTPLTYRDSGESAVEVSSSSRKAKGCPETNNANGLDPSGILDISISLPFEDMMSPLSTASIAPSPASTISSNEIIDNEGNLVAPSRSRALQESSVTLTFTGTSKVSSTDQLRFISNDGNLYESKASEIPSPMSMTITALADTSTTSSSDELSSDADTRDSLEPTIEVGPESDTKSTLDFLGIEDDDSGEEESTLDRRKRRSTLIFLPGPEQHERLSISPDPIKSAFVPVERRQSSGLLRDESLLDRWSPGLLKNRSMSISPMAPTPSKDHLDTVEPEATGHLSHDVARVNDRAILEVIPENCCDCRRVDNAPQNSSNSLMLRFENAALRKKAAYEERVTPFRDVFEDVSVIGVNVYRPFMHLQTTYKFFPLQPTADEEASLGEFSHEERKE